MSHKNLQVLQYFKILGSWANYLTHLITQNTTL